MPYAGVEKIGGKTLVWNQMVDSGTTSVATISGHKYYTLIDGTASIITSSGSAISIVDDSADMVCDLTLMFGSGNEPSTTADFTAIFGATHYAYNEGELLSAGVTEVVSKDSNNATLQTIPIPTAIRNLEGYGWSAGSVYNYIDYERKVFVQNVGSANLGSFDYDYIGGKFVTKTGIPNIVQNVPSWSVFNGVTVKYLADTFIHVLYNTTDKTIAVQSNTSGKIDIFDSAYTDTTTFKSAMNGVYLYYELQTPVETDISEYLTDDNLIQVDNGGGGTLTFPNQNGADYCIPVPSDVTYMIDLQEAINNG
jgi:hypothetical protein